MISRNTLSQSGMRLALLALALMPGVATPVYAQLRIQSSSEEEATTKLATQLEKAHANHLAALDAHRTYLVEALRRERRLVVQDQLALRDARVASILDESDPAKSLGAEIIADWQDLTGTTPTPDLFGSTNAIASDLAQKQILRAALQRHRPIQIKLLEASGGGGQYCDENGAGPVAFAPGSDPTQAALLASTCASLQSNTTQIADLYKDAGPAAGVLGDPNAALGGKMSEAVSAAQEIAVLIKAQELLTHSDLSIAEIAFRCGFASQQHLTATLSKRLGNTPHRLRFS